MSYSLVYTNGVDQYTRMFFYHMANYSSYLQFIKSSLFKYPEIMKTKHRFYTIPLMFLLILIGFIKESYADPYVKCLCMPVCNYCNAHSSYGLCSGDSLELYAICPGGDFCVGNPCSSLGTFQWYRVGWHWKDAGGGKYVYTNGPYPIDGATSNGYTVTDDLGGPYWCEVDCGDGPYHTDTVEFVYHSSDPSISSHPESQDVCIGNNVNFSISASNVHKYQWQKKLSGGDWANISSTNSPEYTFTPDGNYDLSQFRCLVTNGCGSATSNPATLDMKYAPSVTTHPASVSPCEGNSSNLSVTATGDDLSYQWQVSTDDGESWDDLTTSGKYTITNHQMSISDITPDMSGNLYNCIVSGYCSPEVTSASATLTVKTIPTINTSPASQAKCLGEDVFLNVTASGTPPLEYYWRKDETGLGDWSSSAQYELLSLTTNDAGSYDVLVRNECKMTGVESANATVTVKVPPNIDSQTNPDPVCQGEPSIQFSVTASGDNISYQWQMSENGEDDWSDLSNNDTYSGTTLSTLNIVNPTGDMNTQLYRCRVEGDCSPDDTSTEALLTVNVPPSIDTAPKPVTVCLGANFTIAVSVSGTSPLYLWRKDGISLTGWTTSPTYTVTGAGQSDAGSYDVLVKNICTDPSSIESDDATVTVNIPPSISSQPEDITLCEGSQPSVSFSATVPGSGLSYLWEFSNDEGQNWTDLENNTIFSGVTTDELTLSSTDDTLDQYIFRCKIIGVCEPPVTTNSARLTIKTAPEFVAHPEAAEICEGDEVTFTTEVTGTKPFQYRWMKGDASITNWTTDNSYTIFSATLGDIEKYKVLVKNECNSSGVASESAQLNVNPSPYISLGSDRHICTGKSTIIDAGAGYASYNWNTGETSQSITVSDQGNYTVTVLDSKGCENSDNIYIILDPLLPGIDLGEDRQYCSGESVLLDAGSGFDGYTWNDGSTGQTLSVYKTDTYYVTSTRNNTVCISTDTVDIIIAEPYDQEEICLITIDLQTGRNLIIWEKTPGVGILAYNLYRQTNVIGVYELIGTIPYDNLSIFKDTVADPEKRQWVYKITAVDTCNNESDIKVSSYHRPLFLQYTGTDDGVNLEWESYVVEGQEMEFVTYEIYRGSDSTALNKIDEISADLRVYKDVNPVALNNKSFYRVAGVKANPCYPTGVTKVGTGPYSHSMSNLEDNRLQGTGLAENTYDLKLFIFPNPMKDRTTVRFHNSNGNPYQMVLRDLSGKTVRIIENITSSEFKLEKGNLQNGYYLLEISGREQVFRGKLVIE